MGWVHSTPSNTPGETPRECGGVDECKMAGADVELELVRQSSNWDLRRDVSGGMAAGEKRASGRMGAPPEHAWGDRNIMC